jgi:glutamate synthase domain-containing protein 1
VIVLNKYIHDMLSELGERVVNTMRGELEDTDMSVRYTENLKNNMSYLIKRLGMDTVVEIMMEDYGIDIDNDNTHQMILDEIKQVGKGRYIGYLEAWWHMKKGLDPKEAKRAAFALYNIHIIDGWVSEAKRSFLGGKQVGFIEYVQEQTGEMARILQDVDLFADHLYQEIKKYEDENLEITKK